MVGVTLSQPEAVVGSDHPLSDGGTLSHPEEVTGLDHPLSDGSLHPGASLPAVILIRFTPAAALPPPAAALRPFKLTLMSCPQPEVGDTLAGLAHPEEAVGKGGVSVVALPHPVETLVVPI